MTDYVLTRLQLGRYLIRKAVTFTATRVTISAPPWLSPLLKRLNNTELNGWVRNDMVKAMKVTSAVRVRPDPVMLAKKTVLKQSVVVTEQ